LQAAAAAPANPKTPKAPEALASAAAPVLLGMPAPRPLPAM
jgi:hypothetical protein